MPSLKQPIKRVVDNTLETLKSSAETGGKQMAETFNPVDVFSEQILGKDQPQNQEAAEKQKLEQSYKNSTPLPVDKWKNQNQQTEQQKLAELRRQFNYFKGEVEKTQTRNKKEEEEKQKYLLQEEQEKKKREEEQKRQQEASAAPHGKVKKNIMGGKKKKADTSMEMHQELKANRSKG